MSAKRDLALITTHLNADFDALGSMLAAQKLYPDAMVVFPGSQEKTLRNFFVNSVAYLFNMTDIRDVDFSRVRLLVLVDTRQPDRIGRLSRLLSIPEVEVHVYDHHPEMDGDIRPEVLVHHATGATVTILTEILKERKTPISPDEATILLLGIYEDTGSFTFSSTTPRDFEAAAHLLLKGANLNTIANLIAREISQQQLSILNDMFQSATSLNVNGIEITITRVTTDKFVPDFAYLVHKMVKMEGLNAVFALARMENKIYLVARSRIPDVDAGAVATEMGGGGHHFAASASIKGQTLAQAEQRLMEILFKRVRSRQTAAEIMSSPPITADERISCKEAADLLTKYNINALLVTRQTESGVRLFGYITRQVLEKALFHDLAEVPVREYATTEMATIRPDSDMTEIQEKIIKHKQRILPVVENDRILGVLTRTDLLNILVRSPDLPDPGKTDRLAEFSYARTRQVVKFMKERLSTRLIEILKLIGSTAEALGFKAYVVGGFVRDLFLYRPNEDIDIVVEGDGIKFAAEFAKRVGARIHAHEKFGTALIIFPDNFKIDVASARLEYYKFPAALPTVEMSSIKMDLFRRDFTINTLAIQLNPDRFGTMIDFFFAQKDIKERVIRVLHNLSFVEDPTRVFRAIRFEQRFGFQIGRLTSNLIENAVKMGFFKRLSGKRIFAELKLIFEEENPSSAIQRLNDYGLLAVIHEKIRFNNELFDLLDSAQKVLSWYDLLFLEESYMKWAVYFLVSTHGLTSSELKDVCDRFELPDRLRRIFLEERQRALLCLNLLEKRLPKKKSLIYRQLETFKINLLLYMMIIARKDHVKKAIGDFVSRTRFIEPEIRGKDLIELGIMPGPVFKTILERVRDEKINGRLKSLEEELQFVKKRLLKNRAGTGDDE